MTKKIGVFLAPLALSAAFQALAAHAGGYEVIATGNTLGVQKDLPRDMSRQDTWLQGGSTLPAGQYPADGEARCLIGYYFGSKNTSIPKGAELRVSTLFQPPVFDEGQLLVVYRLADNPHGLANIACKAPVPNAGHGSFDDVKEEHLAAFKIELKKAFGDAITLDTHGFEENYAGVQAWIDGQQAEVTKELQKACKALRVLYFFEELDKQPKADPKTPVVAQVDHRNRARLEARRIAETRLSPGCQAELANAQPAVDARAQRGEKPAAGAEQAPAAQPADPQPTATRTPVAPAAR
jgi:hypothetical protein